MNALPRGAISSAVRCRDATCMHIQPASRQADRMTDVITGPHDILLRHVTAVLVPDPVLFCAVCGAVPRRRSRRGAGAGGMH